MITLFECRCMLLSFHYKGQYTNRVRSQWLLCCLCPLEELTYTWLLNTKYNIRYIEAKREYAPIITCQKISGNVVFIHQENNPLHRYTYIWKKHELFTLRCLLVSVVVIMSMQWCTNPVGLIIRSVNENTYMFLEDSDCLQTRHDIQYDPTSDCMQQVLIPG